MHLKSKNRRNNYMNIGKKYPVMCLKKKKLAMQKSFNINFTYMMSHVSMGDIR